MPVRLTRMQSLSSNRVPSELALGRRVGQSIERLERAMVEKRGDVIIETAREARQAERGPSVRNVLVWSTGLVIVAFAIVWFIFFET